jgi:hypothetical protein
MTRGQFVDFIVRCLGAYHKIGPKESILRNSHMNEISRMDLPVSAIPQVFVDALLVDFVNYIATQQGLDLAYYTRDLYKET